MAALMDHPLSQSAILFAVVFLMTAIGFAIARRLRDRAETDKPDRQALMTKFRALHDQGGLSDEEYRTIKTKLAVELKAELNDNGGAD